MLQQLKGILKSSAIYSLGNISTKLVGFILLPIYTNESYLSIDAYGALGLFEGVVQFSTALFGLGIYNGLFRWYYEDEQRKGAIVFTAYSLVMLLAISLITVGFYFEEEIYASLFQDDAFRSAFRFMILAAGLQLITVIPVTVMRLKDKPGLFSATSILRLSINVVGTILLMVVYLKGLDGIYIAQIIGHVSYILITVPFMIKSMKVQFDPRVPTMIWTYSIPLTFSALITIGIQYADRFIINSFRELSDVGIYSLAVKVANVIKMVVITTVSLSLTPFLFKKINEPGHKRFYSKTLTYYGYGLCLLIMFLSIFSYEGIRLIADSAIYWEAYKFVPILSFGLYFTALQNVGFMGFHITKKVWYLTVITVFAVSLNVILNILLIPNFGLYGAATSMLLSNMFYYVVGVSISNQLYTIPYEWVKIFTMPMLASVIIFASFLVNDINLLLRIPVKLFLIGLFPLMLYFGGFYEEIEIQRLKGFYTKWRQPERWWQNIKKFIDQN